MTSGRHYTVTGVSKECSASIM